MIPQPLQPANFYLSKWYLDFIGDHGMAMIFYAAELHWGRRKVHYSGWLSHDRISGTTFRSTFRQVRFPVVTNNTITWTSPDFGITGTWESGEKMISARVFESAEGSVDWICHQPVSGVHLKVREEILAGTGYVERLILTLPPWRLPMDELRWGRYASGGHNLVWTEMKGDETRKWVWLNGELAGTCLIADECILLPDKNLILNLDRAEEIEADKKIRSVMKRLIRFIPGVSGSVPLNFLMADSCKWLSTGVLTSGNIKSSEGKAIHELVKFRVS